MLNNWQRIEHIIKWTGFASVSAFAREIGLNRSENLYQIKRGNNGISKDLAESIVVRFPEVSKAWLLTGEGAMLKGDQQYRACDIPFYKEDAVKVALSPKGKFDPDYFVSFPIFEECDFAAFTMTDAMEPEIPRGAMVFFQEIDPQAAIPGETYLVINATFSGIRYLRRDAKSGDVRLVARNKSDYDEIIIPRQTIEHLYRVRGMVTVK